MDVGNIDYDKAGCLQNAAKRSKIRARRWHLGLVLGNSQGHFPECLGREREKKAEQQSVTEVVRRERKG